MSSQTSVAERGGNNRTAQPDPHKPDARRCVLLANKRLNDKPVKQLLNLTSPGNPCQEKTAIQTVTERDNLGPKGRQYVGPAVRPGKLDVVTMSAEGAAQSECRSFGPRTTGSRSPRPHGRGSLPGLRPWLNRTPKKIRDRYCLNREEKNGLRGF